MAGRDDSEAVTEAREGREAGLGGREGMEGGRAQPIAYIHQPEGNTKPTNAWIHPHYDIKMQFSTLYLKVPSTCKGYAYTAFL